MTREWVARLSCEPWNGGALFSVWCEGSTTGLLVVMIPRSLTSPSERELLLWSSLADQASVALGTQRVSEQVSQHSALSERHRIARDLHDSVSQALFSLHARAQVIRRALAADDPALAAEAAEDLELLSRQATAEMRALLSEMRPEAGGRGDLVPRLQQLADAVTHRDGLPVELTVAPAPLPSLPPTVVEHLARVAGEALHNTVKHAGASAVRVTVTVEDDLLTLVAEDDGCGFDPATTTRSGLGQRTMRERAALLGGELSVRSAPGEGTVVEVSVPLTGRTR
jgi:signal transduction histidine kinase